MNDEKILIVKPWGISNGASDLKLIYFFGKKIEI